jgi:hypothetical protein
VKVVLHFLFFSWVGGVFFGFFIRAQNYALGEKIIGFSVLGAVCFYLPLFLYHRWKGKSLSDYTLTKENLEKMKTKKKE